MKALVLSVALMLAGALCAVAEQHAQVDGAGLSIEALEAEARARMAAEGPGPTDEPVHVEAIDEGPATALERDLRFLLNEFYAAQPAAGDAEALAFRAAMTEVFTESYARAMASHFDYRTQSFDHRGRTFEWQLLSSKIIFATVIALVFAGLLFSAWQFRQAMQMAATLPDGQEMEGKGTKSSFEFSPNGVKVTSNVLGVIILALSLAFFYLYLEHVYEIREVL